MKATMSDGEDVTPLQAAAIGIHESFTAYVEAGFTRDEALRIVLTQMSLVWQKQSGEPER